MLMNDCNFFYITALVQQTSVVGIVKQWRRNLEKNCCVYECEWFLSDGTRALETGWQLNESHFIILATILMTTLSVLWLLRTVIVNFFRTPERETFSCRYQGCDLGNKTISNENEKHFLLCFFFCLFFIHRCRDAKSLLFLYAACTYAFIA